MKTRRLRRRLAERQRAGVGNAVWAFKRERQRSELAAMATGLVSQDQMMWFPGGRTRQLKIIGAPY